MALTEEQQRVLDNDLFKVVAGRPRAEWVAVLREADVCAIEHLEPCEVFDTPQARHNEMVVTVDDPVLGPVEQVAPPAKLRATPGSVSAPAPRAGADGDAGFVAGGWRRPAPAGEPGPGALLAGVKVLDLGAYYAGPYSSRLLADLGAEVIKLEPVAGDPLRGMERPFFSAQAGKRAIAANLKDPDLAPAVAALIEWADVIHHNMRPGAAERLGLGYEQVRAVKPSIVYLHAPGWGSDGPEQLRQSFAPMLSGYAGIGLLCAGQYNPPLFPIGNEDPGNGLLGAVGALLALLHRQRHGAGQFVENPQLNATMAHMAHAVRDATGTPVGVGGLDPMQMGRGPFERLYRTVDGWVVVVAATDTARRGLAGVAGVDLSDAALRGEDPDGVAWMLAEALEAQPTALVLAGLDAAGVPAVAPVGPNMQVVLTDPAYRASGRVAEVEHPTKGTVREIASLVRVSDCAPVAHRLAPGLGEHSDEILRAVGYDDDRIATLRARSVVR